MEILQRAVADYDGEAQLMTARMWPAKFGVTAGNEEERVQVFRLDRLLGNEVSVDLVKVDVEGFEWQVLRGATSIMPRIRRWLVELHDPSRKDELDSLLRSLGYETKWITHPKRYPHVLAHRPSDSL